MKILIAWFFTFLGAVILIFMTNMAISCHSGFHTQTKMLVEINKKLEKQNDVESLRKLVQDHNDSCLSATEEMVVDSQQPMQIYQLAD